jgi:tetratricopeptide (TPR) repeat protein
MESHNNGQAVEQYVVAYRTLMRRGDSRQAGEVEAKIRRLDPLMDASAAASKYDHADVADGEIVAEFGEIELPATVSSKADEEEGEEEGEPLPMFGFDEEEEGEEQEEEAEPLPLMRFGSDEAPATRLPVSDEVEEPEPAGVLDASAFGEADYDERETKSHREGGEEMVELDAGLSDFSVGEREEAFEEAAADSRTPEPLPLLEEAPPLGSGHREEATLGSLRAQIADSPDDINLRQRLVELAYRSGDEASLVEAYVGLGQNLDRAGQPARARAAYQQVLQLDPGHPVAKSALGQSVSDQRPVKEVASHVDYVDLGSLILGDEEEKTTRFVVAYAEPSGDEQADFAKMLSQFKAKVSQNLEADDVRAHHDLGTAYKEMGLLDEAVAEFQQALRASANHLPTYEMLGQTFLEMGMYDAAVRSLERALEVPYEIEDELLAIYYYLGRAYEKVGKKDSAIDQLRGRDRAPACASVSAAAR